MTREEAKQWLEAMKSAYALPIETYEAIDMAIEALQTDAVSRINYTPKPCENANCDCVEVVRCKDCRHKVVTKDGEYNEEDIVCDYWLSDGLDSNDFCSYGERREP